MEATRIAPKRMESVAECARLVRWITSRFSASSLYQLWQLCGIFHAIESRDSILRIYRRGDGA
jgi:hypothetical protein